MSFVSRLFLALGTLLLIMALGTRFLFSDWDIPGLFFLGGSFFLLLLGFFLDKSFYTSLLKRPATRRGVSFLLTCLFLAAVLIGFNYGVSFFSWKIDFTKEKLHTLSEWSRQTVKAFQQPVEFLYLQIPDENSKSADESVRVALQKYVDENPLFKMTKLNIMEHPELVKKFKLNEKEQAMFVVMQDRYERFYRTDENSITQALLRLLKGRKTLYFSVGHNEISLSNTNTRGLSSLKKEVERLFYDTQEVNLEKEVIPQDAAALIIVGPEKTLSQEFRQKVYDYFVKGGRVFVAFDPVQNADETQFLAPFGAVMSTGVVHQEQNALANVGSFVVAGGLPKEANHALLRNLTNDSPVMFYVTGALSRLVPSEFQFTPLVVSSEDSKLLQGFSKQDKELGKGSHVLFAAIENKNGGVLLVSADSDLFVNQFLYQHLNSTFMFNVFSFLSKDQDVVKPHSIKDVAQDFLVTDTNFTLYVGLFAIPLPLFFLSFSGFWWYRRRWS